MIYTISKCNVKVCIMIMLIRYRPKKWVKVDIKHNEMFNVLNGLCLSTTRNVYTFVMYSRELETFILEKLTLLMLVVFHLTMLDK